MLVNLVGNGENALERIKGKIELKKPIFSNFDTKVTIFNEDANVLVKHLKNVDITYIEGKRPSQKGKRRPLFLSLT